MRLALLYIMQHVHWIVLGSTFLVLTWLLFLQIRSTLSFARLQKAVWLILSSWLISLLVYGVTLWIYFSGSTYAKALLPPHSTVLIENITQGLVTYLAGAIAAAVSFVLLRYLFIKKTDGAKMDTIDIALLVVSAFAVGWPTVFVLYSTIFLLSILGMLILIILRKRTINDRLIITPFILPSAIITLFTGPYLLTLTHLDKIRF